MDCSLVPTVSTSLQTIVDKTFAVRHRIAKFMKVFCYTVLGRSTSCTYIYIMIIYSCTQKLSNTIASYFCVGLLAGWKSNECPTCCHPRWAFDPYKPIDFTS